MRKELRVGQLHLQPGDVVVMDGYRGDKTPRVGKVDRVLPGLVTVKDVARDEFRSYKIEFTHNLRKVKV